MAKFVCEECNYRFEKDVEQVSRKCPYCGKDGIKKEPSAQEIIDKNE